MIEKAQLKILQGNYKKDQYSLALQENDFRDCDIACHYPIGMPNVFVDQMCFSWALWCHHNCGTVSW